MTVNINITRRIRRRKLASGEEIKQPRYVLSWRDPKTGDRDQRFFVRQKDAIDARAQFISAFERGAPVASRASLTVSDAIDAWLNTKRGVVRPTTFASYEFQVRSYIVGPLPPAEARRAKVRSGKGKSVEAKPIALLGQVKVADLATRTIRDWHRIISDEVSPYSAGKALSILKAALALAAEDHEFRPPAMPTGLQRRRDKERKAVLTAEQVAVVLEGAKADPERGVYVAFPFLAGTRPSEQLGLLWDCVDFERNVLTVRRVQLKDGSLVEMTKTEASRRDVPMSPQLRAMLLDWRVRCPRKDGNLERVFPALGNLRAWPLPRENGGGPLIYNNFRTRFWAPALKRLGLPPVTPHSARHSFISILQAQGVEVALVAKLAGHKNAVVTLSIYSHAMRGGEEAVRALDRAFQSLA